MKFSTVLEIYKEKGIDTPLFNADSAFYDFMTDYLQSYHSIDFNLLQKFSSYIYCYEEVEPVSAFLNFTACFLGYLDTHKEAYARMWTALNAEYNPLENYNGDTTLTVEETGKETNKNTKAGKVTSDNTVTGTKSSELSITGTKTSTMQETPTSGSYTDTETRQVSAEGGSTFNNENKVTKEFAKRGETNTDSFSDYKETTTDSANSFHDKTETSYSNDYADTNEKSFTNRKTTTTEVKHGNLGLTTSQQMIESELSLRLKYNFYDMMFADFIKEYCIL